MSIRLHESVRNAGLASFTSKNRAELDLPSDKTARGILLEHCQQSIRCLIQIICLNSNGIVARTL